MNYFIILLFLLTSCLANQHQDQEKKQTLTTSRELFESQPFHSLEHLKKIMKENKKDLITELHRMKKEGNTDRQVWSAEDYFPMKFGGTVSAMEKYDEALKRTEPLAANWESADSQSYEMHGWAGHCNGNALASIHQKKPIHGVLWNETFFYPKELQMLLAESYSNSSKSERYITFGGRCEQSFTSLNFLSDNQGRIDETTCRDLNPGLFHIVISNFLGEMLLPLIADDAPDREVWNYPLVEYATEYKEITQDQAKDFYKDIPLNPQGLCSYLPSFLSSLLMTKPCTIQAHHYYKVSTYIGLAKHSNLSSKVNVTHLAYILETDEENRIIGGEWDDESKINHPDFLWYDDKVLAINPHFNPEHALGLLQTSQKELTNFSKISSQKNDEIKKSEEQLLEFMSSSLKETIQEVSLSNCEFSMKYQFDYLKANQKMRSECHTKPFSVREAPLRVSKNYTSLIFRDTINQCLTYPLEVETQGPPKPTLEIAGTLLRIHPNEDNEEKFIQFNKLLQEWNLSCLRTGRVF